MEKNGIIVIDKDPGITSFDVVARLRKILGIKRIGHCGTLDPFATGVLPVAFGRGTAVIQFMEDYRKTYQVLAVLGEATTTMDIEGARLDQANLEQVALDYKEAQLQEKLDQALAKFSGDFKQTPPMFSAIKHEGKPLYQYAREGQEVKRPSRPVNIQVAEASLLAYDKLLPLLAAKSFPDATLDQISDLETDKQLADKIFLYAEADVSKGTYIRSWIDDIGRDMGTYAHCLALRRIECGPYKLLGKNPNTEFLLDQFDHFAGARDEMYSYLQKEGYVQGLETALPDARQMSLDLSTALELIDGKRPDLDFDTFLEYQDEPFLAFYNQKLVGLIAAKGDLDQRTAYLQSMRIFSSKEVLCAV